MWSEQILPGDDNAAIYLFIARHCFELGETVETQELIL